MENFKLKFINDNLRTIEAKKRLLNTWEKEFYESVRTFDPNKLSQSQRNTLTQIVERIG